MALDKDTIKGIGIRYGGDEIGEPDNYVNVKLNGHIVFGNDELLNFAQAIYAIGVADERERIAKMFDESGWHPYAEVIRNSNNARMDCDSKSDK